MIFLALKGVFSCFIPYAGFICQKFGAIQLKFYCWLILCAFASIALAQHSGGYVQYERRLARVEIANQEVRDMVNKHNPLMEAEIKQIQEVQAQLLVTQISLMQTISKRDGFFEAIGWLLTIMGGTIVILGFFGIKRATDFQRDIHKILVKNKGI